MSIMAYIHAFPEGMKESTSSAAEVFRATAVFTLEFYSGGYIGPPSYRESFTGWP
jgi:hypothetical protein